MPMVEPRIRIEAFSEIGYLMKVDAKAVGVFVDSGQLSCLAVLGTCKSDARPSGIDVKPYRRVAFLDYFE
jgi:hypothetical protein